MEREKKVLDLNFIMASWYVLLLVGRKIQKFTHTLTTTNKYILNNIRQHIDIY